MNESYRERATKLFTPGPGNIPNRVAIASFYMNYHHRSNEFSNILIKTLDNLKLLFGTENQVLPIHTTGRGALEGVYNNILTPQDKVICICNGSFGEMAANTLKCNCIPYVAAFSNWEQDVDLEQLENLIIKEEATAIVAVHNDTSNGIVNPIWDIGKLARKYDLIFIVDTVSGLGCTPFKFDEWGIDAAVTASQKGLMSPAGISFGVISPRAMDICQKTIARDFYINLKDIMGNLDTRNQTPGSTPVSLVLAVNEAIDMIYEEGLENVFLRHHALSKATKEALVALGFELFPKECKNRSDSLTVCRVPVEMDTKQILSHLNNKYHIKIGSGLKDYSNSTIRIAHMGYCYIEDMLQCITAIEATLFDLGYIKSIGNGINALLKKYNEIMFS